MWPHAVVTERKMKCGNIGGNRNVQFEAVVREIIAETWDTKTLRFDRPAAFDFIPGQFLKVFVNLPGGGEAHRAFSIASSPLESVLDLTVRRFPAGRVSPVLTDLVRVGDTLTMKGPYGRFVIDEKPMIWIAGGSGIVPFRSMWRYLEQQNPAGRYALLYAVKTSNDIIYASELNRLAASGRQIILTLTLESPVGWPGFRRRIDADMLRLALPQIEDKVFYVCGPPAMCDEIALQLARMGVERCDIRIEKYD
jgi:ferredoxin-NADP reductase